MYIYKIQCSNISYSYIQMINYNRLHNRSLEFITAHLYFSMPLHAAGNWLIMSPTSVPLMTSSNSLQRSLFMKYVHLQQKFGANHTTPGGQTLPCPARRGWSRGRRSAEVCLGKLPAGDVSADSLRTGVIIIIGPSTFNTTPPLPLPPYGERRIWIIHSPLQPRQSNLLLTMAKEVQCLLHSAIHVYYRPQHQVQTRPCVSAKALNALFLINIHHDYFITCYCHI